MATAHIPDDPHLPFSRPCAVSSLGEGGAAIEVRANEDERAALARADALVALHDLSGSFTIEPARGGGVRVTGTVTARVRQTCVVTLEPFDSSVSEPVDVDFLPERTLAARAARTPKREAAGPDAPADEDVPDPIVNGTIDLGALAAEFLALALDPYPRKPGVAFEEPAPPPADGGESPFAVLGRLKARDGSPETG